MIQYMVYRPAACVRGGFYDILASTYGPRPYDLDH